MIPERFMPVVKWLWCEEDSRIGKRVVGPEEFGHSVEAVRVDCSC